jgi:signal transduction histidine kinase
VWYSGARQVSDRVIDVLLALLVAFHAVWGVVDDVPMGTLGMAGILLLLAGTLCLAWRRRAPRTVLAISGIAYCAYVAFGYPAPPLPFGPLIALYTVAVAFTVKVSLLAAATLATSVLAAASVQPGRPSDELLDYLGALLAGWTLGYLVRLNQGRATLEQERAGQLERDQSVNARQAVEQERARIARELHDIVAHRLSVIVAQAGASRRVFGAQPEQAPQALAAIETIGREALVEMRWLLGVLQTDEDGTDRSPQPGLDQLPALIEQVERAGLPVRLVIEGTPRPLPAGVELNAFRIIQEGLTNTLKHAGPAYATVMLSYREGFLDVQISDDGRGAGLTLAPGHGHVGMQQRAVLLGGELSAGPLPDGGYQVNAHLPVGGEGL